MNTVTLHFKADNQQLTALDGLYKLASNTVEYVKAVFTLGENWTGFDVVRAAWYTDFECISTVLDGNGECFVPWEVLSRPEGVTINLYGCDLEEESDGEAVLIDRLTTYPVKAILVDVDARVCGSETKPVTPSQFEQYIAIVEQIVGTVKDIDHTKLTADYCLIIYYTDGTNSGKLGPIRGEQGAPGATGATPDFSIGEVETLAPGEDATATITGTAENPVLNLGIPKGEQGDVSIADLAPFMIEDTASGTIASFPDGQAVFPLKSCVVNIDPVQDLHGYDKPWVGGAGKNKFLTDFEAQTVNGITFTKNDDGTVKANGTMASATDFIIGHIELKAGSYILNGCPAGGGSSSYRLQVTDYPVVNNLGFDIGSGVSFTINSDMEVAVRIQIRASVNNVVFSPMIRLSTVADGTYAPFANICPITGWTGCEVVKTGKNLYPYSSIPVYTYTFAVTPSLSDAENPVFLKGGEQYRLTLDTGNSVYRFRAWDKFGKIISDNATMNAYSGATQASYYSSYQFWGDSSNNNYMTFAPTENIWLDFVTQTTASVQNQLEVGSSASAHEQYNGTTYPVSWQTEAGTVYGGSIDVVSGVLTVTHGYLDLGTLEWAYSSTYGFFANVTVSGYPAPKAGTHPISDAYKSATWQDDMSIYLIYSDRIGVHDSRYTDGNTFTQAVNGFHVVYELATPITYQLDPVQVACLLGQNNIFADCGAVAVRYIADIGLYIDKKTS